MAVTYMYLLIPIIIFFGGWLKPAIALFCTVCLGVGFLVIYISERQKELCFYLPYKVVIILVTVIFIWMLIAGCGGYVCVQRSDLHWRNATFHDLIEYSWPVVYPETENALVYYFIFWMVPALFGKILGFTIANAVLFWWIFLGVFLTSIYICMALQIKTIREMSIFLVVFIIWGGVNVIGQLIAYVVTGHVADWIIYFVWADMFTPGLQYTPNNALLEWCFNQTIVPWLVTAMFLEDKTKDVCYLAYLGLCVLPYAPLPFCGIVIIFLAWGLYKMFTEYKNRKKLFIIDMLSIPNITAVLAIVLVFWFFYSINAATAGGSGSGGIGFLVEFQDFTAKRWLILFLFYFIEFACYSLVLLKIKKKSFLFWIVNISLIFIPFFKIGEGNDFCMRASIPALFMLMFWIMQYLLNHKNAYLSYRTIALIGFLTISMLGTCVDWGVSVKIMLENHMIRIIADDIQTFSDKSPSALTRGVNLNNYLTENADEYLFFKSIAKKRKGIEKDYSKSIAYREQNGYVVPSGRYFLVPYMDSDSYIGFDKENQLILTSERYQILLGTENGSYQISFNENGLGWRIEDCVIDSTGTISLAPRVHNMEQSWKIQSYEDVYIILYGENYAVTYADCNISLKKFTGGDNQKWKIIKES